MGAPQQHSMNCFHIEGHEPYTSALPPHSSVKRHIFTTPAGERDVKKSNLTETTHTPQAPCTPRLPTQAILFCVLTRAQRNACALQPAALAFVPYGFVLVRVSSPEANLRARLAQLQYFEGELSPHICVRRHRKRAPSLLSPARELVGVSF